MTATNTINPAKTATCLTQSVLAHSASADRWAYLMLNIEVRIIDSLNHKIRAEQIRLIYRQGPVMVLGATLAATVVAAFLWQSAEVQGLLIWISLIVVSALFRIAVFYSFARYSSLAGNSDSPAAENLVLWGRLFWLGSLLSGTVWGALPLLLADDLSSEHLLVISTIFAGMVAVTASAGSIYLPSFYTFAVPMIVLLVWVQLQTGVDYLILTAALLLLYLVVSALLANRGHRQYVELIKAREHNTALMERVSTEKTIAEKAVVAKNRFMAAASHDLRQPLHALNMFIGSLRNRDDDPDRLSILSDMDASARALGQLLFSLQDISKLDAGVLQPKFKSVALNDLLQNLQSEFEPQAEQKGLKWVLEPVQETYVSTDPVLLERIVRNLIANAIRYTEHGEVRIQAERSSTQVQLSVSDTGVGIPLTEQEGVFEEYRQLAAPVTAHEQGLGLGLSIVRRFSALLDIPLVLESSPGSGSKFTLMLPESRAFGYNRKVKDRADATLEDLCVLLVDDELVVREAVGRCLVDWGCRVLTAASAKEAVYQIAVSDEAPVILLCDYRLRNNESGIDVVHAVREGLNQMLPAIVITGDTSTECLHDAAKSGMKVIHKPVQEQELRIEMMASLQAESAR